MKFVFYLGFGPLLYCLLQMDGTARERGELSQLNDEVINHRKG